MWYPTDLETKQTAIRRSNPAQKATRSPELITITCINNKTTWRSGCVANAQLPSVHLSDSLRKEPALLCTNEQARQLGCHITSGSCIPLNVWNIVSPSWGWTARVPSLLFRGSVLLWFALPHWATRPLLSFSHTTKCQAPSHRTHTTNKCKHPRRIQEVFLLREKKSTGQTKKSSPNNINASTSEEGPFIMKKQGSQWSLWVKLELTGGTQLSSFNESKRFFKNAASQICWCALDSAIMHKK